MQGQRLRHVLHTLQGKENVFSERVGRGKIAGYYRSVVTEQDARSPHCYANEAFGVKEGDVVVDAGAAEGIFTLDCIDRAKKVYIIEADAAWMEALKETFREDGGKGMPDLRLFGQLSWGKPCEH